MIRGGRIPPPPWSQSTAPCLQILHPLPVIDNEWLLISKWLLGCCCRLNYLGYFRECLLLWVTSTCSSCLISCLANRWHSGHCCVSWHHGSHSTVLPGHLPTVWRLFSLLLHSSTSHGQENQGIKLSLNIECLYQGSQYFI